MDACRSRLCQMRNRRVPRSRYPVQPYLRLSLVCKCTVHLYAPFPVRSHWRLSSFAFSTMLHRCRALAVRTTGPLLPVTSGMAPGLWMISHLQSQLPSSHRSQSIVRFTTTSGDAVRFASKPTAAARARPTPAGFTSLQVTTADVSLRLSRFLRSRLPPTVSLARLDQHCRKGAIRVRHAAEAEGAGEPRKVSHTTKFDASYRVALGDRILVLSSWLSTGGGDDNTETTAASPSTRKPISEEHKTLLLESVLYEDEHVCVINKPAGWAVHGERSLSRMLLCVLILIRALMHACLCLQVVTRSIRV